MLIDICAIDHSMNCNSIQDRYFRMDQSIRSNRSPRFLANGKESYAISRSATFLQQKKFEFAKKLFLAFGNADLNDDTLLRNNLLSALIDQSIVSQEIEEQSSSAAPAYRQIEARLHAVFEIEPLEDGVNHPAEEIVGEALQSIDEQCILEWLKTFSMDAAHPSFAASVLRCLGRQDRLGTVAWRVEVIQETLTMDNVEIRDAAVQAAESWGDSEIREILQAHSEPERWLREYIEDVIDDLGE